MMFGDDTYNFFQSLKIKLQKLSRIIASKFGFFDTAVT